MHPLERTLPRQLNDLKRQRDERKAVRVSCDDKVKTKRSTKKLRSPFSIWNFPKLPGKVRAAENSVEGGGVQGTLLSAPH